jgi:general secretion pathway protein J
LNPRRRDCEVGFTLVELLVAVTLLALLTTLVFGAIRYAARAWAETDHRAVATADLAAVQDVFRHSITGAYPAFASTDRTDHQIAFDGGGEWLALVAPLPMAIASGVEARQRFFVEGEGGSWALVLGWRFDLPSSDEATPLQENRVRLLDHVRALRLAYYGVADSTQAPRWWGRWSGYSRLPDLVRVHIERADPALPGWPDILVEPRVTANTACRYEAADPSCRRFR